MAKLQKPFADLLERARTAKEERKHPKKKGNK